VDRALLAAPAGSVTMVRRGEYAHDPQQYLRDVNRSLRTVVRAFPADKGKVLLTGDYNLARMTNLTIAGFRQRTGSLALDPGNRNLALVGNDFSITVQVRQCWGCSIVRNRFHHVPHQFGNSSDGFALFVNGSWGCGGDCNDESRSGIDGLRIVGNSFVHLHNDAIQVASHVRNLQIDKNVFRDGIQLDGDRAHMDGIQFVGGVSNALIRRNRFIDMPSSVLIKDGPTRRVVIRGNLMSSDSRAGYAITAYDGSIVIDDNVILGRRTETANGIHVGDTGLPTKVAILNNIAPKLALEKAGLMAFEDCNVWAYGRGQGRRNVNNASPLLPGFLREHPELLHGERPPFARAVGGSTTAAAQVARRRLSRPRCNVDAERLTELGGSIADAAAGALVVVAGLETAVAGDSVLG
jgi:hypothetical protein